MRLSRTQFAEPYDSVQSRRYFVDGKRISRAHYLELSDSAKRKDSFLTESVSLAGGFMGYRHSMEIYV